MVIDHVSKAFFPENIPMEIIGRIAFPLFAYCIAVGCLYTHSLKKYVLRLFVFALISQPFVVLAHLDNGDSLIQNILSPNIFFTLLAGVIAISACMNLKKRWWLFIIPIAMEIFIGLDYGFYGIVLMLIFYLCRDHSWLSALLVVAWTAWMWLSGDFVSIFGFGIDKQLCSLLALPLIYFHTSFNPKINKYFFYAFYPAQWLAIFLLKMLGVV
jgi:hypothetical protein